MADCRWLSLIFLSVCLVGCSGPGELPAGPEGSDPELAEPAAEPAPKSSGRPFVRMTTKRGELVIEMRQDLAPLTVERFVELAKAGFYYNTLFHRVMPGRMIQGGDPNSKDNNPYNDGQGNSGSFLRAEFSEEPFRRGTVAMARQPHDPHSASSQFFICLQRVPQWDGEYTVFGRVVEGIEVAERISKSPLSRDPKLKERPAAPMWIKQVQVEYR